MKARLKLCRYKIEGSQLNGHSENRGFIFVFSPKTSRLASHLAQKQKLHYNKLNIDHLQSIDHLGDPNEW